MKCNNEIRSKAKEKGIKHWQIAEELKINEGSFCRKLRHELTTDETQKILSIIDELSEKGA